MSFKYTRLPSGHKDKMFESVLEKIPGLLSWTILIGIFSLIFIKPFWGAIFIILFELYWLIRLLYMTVVLILGYLSFEIEKRNDWLGFCKLLSKLGAKKFSEELNKNMNSYLISTFSPAIKAKERFRDFLYYLMYAHRLLLFKKKVKSESDVLNWEDIYHIVIFPVVNEKRKILRDSLEALAKVHYPRHKFIVLIAAEERGGEYYINSIRDIVEEFKNYFFHCEYIVHPDKMPGETRVKGANITYAAKKIRGFLEKNNIDFEKAIVSIFDSDTRAGADYFACLTYHYIINKDRIRRSYQPVPIYDNNIWEVPSFSRVMEMGSSFWIMMESTKVDTLVTFSSHSLSYKTLVDVDFWPCDMISDDSAIYWKSYLHYNSHYEVDPLYTPVSMNMVSGETTLKTFGAIYRQKRRWAYGIENFPILARGFIENNNIPFGKKARCLFRMLDTHISWATWAFIITISGWLFIFAGSRNFNATVLSFLTPKILSIIFNLAGISLIVAIILSVTLLPKNLGKISAWDKFKFSMQWILLPFIYPILGALPALDAQTRLLIGKKMQFQITPK